MKDDPFLSYLDIINNKSSLIEAKREAKREKTMKLTPINIKAKEKSQTVLIEPLNPLTSNKKANEEKIEINEKDFNSVDLQYIKLNLLEKMASYQKNAVHSLWKIEAEHNFDSQFIQWNAKYRFRHFVTGKYLRLVLDKPKEVLGYKITDTEENLEKTQQVSNITYLYKYVEICLFI